MDNFSEYDVFIFDYEGTLSVSPKKVLSLAELLNEFDFRDLEPNKKVYDFVQMLNNKKIYIVGCIECNREIEQKKEWLGFNYPMIEKDNYIFISGEHKKSEAVQAIIEKNNYNKEKIVFIDDKMSHINDVSNLGIRCILVEEI